MRQHLCVCVSEFSYGKSLGFWPQLLDLMFEIVQKHLEMTALRLQKNQGKYFYE